MDETATREDVARLLRGRSNHEIDSAIEELGEEAILDRVIAAVRTTARPTGQVPHNAVVRWEIIGVRGARYFLSFVVVDGEFDAQFGLGPEPRATISITTTNFLRLIAGELDVVRAYFARKLRVTGDVMFARNVEHWFK